MSGKNESPIQSTEDSPYELSCSSECHLSDKSSITINTSQPEENINDYIFSYSSNKNTLKESQPLQIKLVVKQQTFSVNCLCVSTVRKELQRIFSVCRLSQLTKVSLAIIFLHRITENNSIFHCLLQQYMELYQQVKFQQIVNKAETIPI